MVETSMFFENSGGAATVAGGTAVGGGGGGSVSGGSGEEERLRGDEADRSFSGNRWPREETLALLKIRSEMNVAFRDSPIKAPLWDEVSRKLAELGYYRNAKKCKEKFENIYKYHRRTKESRSGRQNGKNYRFFEQLEVFDTQTSPSSNKIETSTETTMPMPTMMTETMIMTNPTSFSQDFTVPCSIQNPMSTSSMSSPGKEFEGNVKKKRKLEDYFQTLMKSVLEKQENLQNKFIEAVEKYEKDRIAREEEWKMQEMERIKKEQEMVAQERALTAAKDAAVIAFLRKISDQTNTIPENPIPPSSPPREKIVDKREKSIGENSIQTSSSRWPKAEVEALIAVRTNLELQYQGNGPKGSLWEEISFGMKKLGYDRSAKRCKEKWENINKYFKRVKESNKKRAEDSKTCTYFHMLESLYERKSKKIDDSNGGSGYSMKPEDILMHMMKQQQQQEHHHHQGLEAVTGDGESENVEQNQDDDDDDDNGDDYQIVANNLSYMTTME